MLILNWQKNVYYNNNNKKIDREKKVLLLYLFVICGWKKVSCKLTVVRRKLNFIF